MNPTVKACRRLAHGKSPETARKFGKWVITLLLGSIAATGWPATHWVDPGQDLQTIVDQSAPGDTIILRDGFHPGPLVIRRALTLRAEHPGQAVLTNRFAGPLTWKREDGAGHIWRAEGIDWPVNWLWVDGVSAFDYRTPTNFADRTCGPFWSKGWQEKVEPYSQPPYSFAHDSKARALLLRLPDDRDPNQLEITIPSRRLQGETLMQKDLGTSWNQQDVVSLSPTSDFNPQRVNMWYGGTRENPTAPRYIDYPAGFGVLVEIEADSVVMEGLRLEVGPTLIIDVNDSSNVTIRDCIFSGYQFALNSGYRATQLTVERCEFDGGGITTKSGHRDVNLTMWSHSVYVVPILYKGTGLTFRHNYVYEGFDLFHPRGRHKDFPDVPDLPSDVAFNVWQAGFDNNIEFDGVEARMNLRFHHNLVLSDHDALAITTTENGGPLLIDHNLWWPGGGRIIKLIGTGRTNRGVIFAHNTYFSGNHGVANRFEDSLFINNIVLGGCVDPEHWTRATLGEFFPAPQNLMYQWDGDITGFHGPTSEPRLGQDPATRFLLLPDSPAINAGKSDSRLFQDNVADGQPDLGALEYGETLEDWRRRFGHCGPRWINAENARTADPNRPVWPAEIDRRWGGLD